MHRIVSFRCFRAALLLAAFLFAPSALPSAKAEITERDRKLVQQVLDRLLSVTERPPGYDVWPPTIDIVDTDTCNAFAYLDRDQLPKKVPRIKIFLGEIVKTAGRDPDVLAMTIGHELGHIVLGHIKLVNPDTPMARLVFTREHEIDADRFGMETALRANFDYRKLIKSFTSTYRQIANYSSLEGLSVDHPSWTDRAALLDQSHRNLWRSMSAFENGVSFLEYEQYENAELCFRRVIRDFPNCDEAYANLGYALLMQYCDRLDPSALKQLNIGQIAAGGFYRRSDYLEGQLDRGSKEALWTEAVSALQTAVALNPKQRLAKMNLGLAYLVRPVSLGGKDPNASLRYLREVSAEISPEKQPYARALLLSNQSVAQAAAGQPEAALDAMNQAEKMLNELVASVAGFPKRTDVSDALLYNRARVLAASKKPEDRRKALALFQQYLASTDSGGVWWSLAREQYEALTKEFGGGQAKVDVGPSTVPAGIWRIATGIKTTKNVVIHLAQPLGELERSLGMAATTIPIVRGTNLRRLCYPQAGIELVATDEVVIIVLKGENAPSIEMHKRGLGAETAVLRVGMTKEEVQKIMGEEGQLEPMLEGNPEDFFRVFGRCGVGVKVRKGKVVEIAVYRAPRGTK